MSVNANDLLSYGIALSQGPNEMQWRTSIGRSYYAAYHVAAEWHSALPSFGVSTGNYGAHETLIRCLTTPTVQGKARLQSMSIGYVLRALKANRTQADYDLSCAIDGPLAATTVELSKSLLVKAGAIAA